MRNWRWKAVAAVLCGVAACPRASGQFRLKTTDGSGSSITRGVKNKENQKLKDKLAAEKSCLYHLAKAEEYFGQGRVGPACQKLRKARALLVTRELAEKWGALGKRIDAAGHKQVLLGEKAFKSKHYRKAIKIYLLASRTFSGLPAAERARQRLRDAENDPDVAAVLAEEKAADAYEIVKAILQRHRRRSAGGARPAATTTRPAGGKPAEPKTDFEVIRELDDDNFLRVADLLARIVKDYATTPTGQETSGLLETLNADARWKQRLEGLRAGRKAHQELAKANAYCNAGLLKKAAAMYRDVIKKYPRSPHADQANKQLGIIEAKLGTR